MIWAVLGIIFILCQATVAIVYITAKRRAAGAVEQQRELSGQLAEIKARMDSIERVLKTVD